MLAAATARGLNTVQADMRSLPFDVQFDAVFSNAAIHWVRDQAAVAAGVPSRPKARADASSQRWAASATSPASALLCNLSSQTSISTAEHEAASRYPSQNEMRTTLESTGFKVVSIQLIPRPTLVQAGMDNWLRTSAQAS